MQEEEFAALTSVVILSDCLWALRAITGCQMAKSHKKFVASLRSDLQTLGERSPHCVFLLHHVRAHTDGTDRASLGNASADLLAKEGACLAYAMPRPHPPCPPLRSRQRRQSSPGPASKRRRLSSGRRPPPSASIPTSAVVSPGPPRTGPALPVRAYPQERAGVG